MKVTTDTSGWTNGFGDQTDVWTSPDGERYAVCRNGERADVMLQSTRMKQSGLAPLALRLYDTSSRRRADRRKARAVKRGERAKGRRARATLR